MLVLAVTLHNILEGIAISVAFAGILAKSQSIMLAGAMLYVVVEELVPEASEGEHSNIGTIGFAMLDVAWG